MKLWRLDLGVRRCVRVACVITILAGCANDAPEPEGEPILEKRPGSAQFDSGQNPSQNAREGQIPPQAMGSSRPVVAGGRYVGDIKLVQLGEDAYADPPDASLSIRSTIAEACFGPIVRVQANGAMPLMVIGQVPDNGFVSRKRIFLAADTDSLQDIDPAAIQSVRVEIFITAVRLASTDKPLTFLVHAIPPGWDVGGGTAIQTTKTPSSHHSHFITPVKTPAGAPALLKIKDYDLAWNHGGASWDYARSQSGLMTWREFLGGKEPEEQPVIGRWNIDTSQAVGHAGKIGNIYLDVDYVRDQLRDNLPISFMIRHENDSEPDATVLNDRRMQGEVIAMSENATDTNSHPRLIVDLSDGKRRIVAPRGSYSED